MPLLGKLNLSIPQLLSAEQMVWKLVSVALSLLKQCFWKQHRKQTNILRNKENKWHTQCPAEQVSHMSSYLKVLDNADYLSDRIGVGYCTLVSHGPQLSKNSNQFPKGSIRDIRPVLFQHWQFSRGLRIVHRMATKNITLSGDNNKSFFLYQYWKHTIRGVGLIFLVYMYLGL